MATGTIQKPLFPTYIDITVTPNSNGVFQFNSASGGVVDWTNFLSAYVIGKNYTSVDVYTYSNLLYGRLRNFENISVAETTEATVRVWYRK